MAKIMSKLGKIWDKAARMRLISPGMRLQEIPAQKPEYKPNKPHRGWKEVAGRRIYFRSKWEANYGMYLQWQKNRSMIKDWHHEPKTFWFKGIRRGCVSYLPDFRITHLDDSHEWIEVKGYMDSKSKTKIKRFGKYFPEEKLRVVDSKWYRENCAKLARIVPGWE